MVDSSMNIIQGWLVGASLKTIGSPILGGCDSCVWTSYWVIWCGPTLPSQKRVYSIVFVTTYMDDACLPKLDFSGDRISKIYQIFLVGLFEEILGLVSKSRQKRKKKKKKKRTNGGQMKQKEVTHVLHVPTPARRVVHACAPMCLNGGFRTLPTWYVVQFCWWVHEHY